MTEARPKWDGSWSIVEAAIGPDGKISAVRYVQCVIEHDPPMPPHKMILEDYKSAFYYARGMTHSLTEEEQKTKEFFPMPSDPTVPWSEELTLIADKSMALRESPHSSEFGGMYG